MKIAFVLSFVTLALASEFNMEFKEGGKKFVEKIKVDLAGNTEEISVPKHMNRLAVDVLKDFNVGLVAEKVVADKACYISAVRSEDSKPVRMETSMLLTKAKFPTSRYEVIQNMVLPLGKLSSAAVGTKIAAHCAGFELIKVLVAEKDKIDESVTKMLRSGELGIPASRTKRQTIVEKFTICDMDSSNAVVGCQRSNLIASCHFSRPGQDVCIWRVNCPVVAGVGFRCSGTHVYNSLTCCDLVCKT